MHSAGPQSTWHPATSTSYCSPTSASGGTGIFPGPLIPPTYFPATVEIALDLRVFSGLAAPADLPRERAWADTPQAQRLAGRLAGLLHFPCFKTQVLPI